MGTVIAFAFLVGLLVGPVQMATQVLTEAQNAIASWRRVIDLLDTPADVVDPGPAGRRLSDGVLGAQFDHVTFAYPGGPDVLHDIAIESSHVSASLSSARPARARRRSPSSSHA